jgi:hypothetical protein
MRINLIIVGRKEMSMNIRNQFTVRALVVYLVALAAAWILTEVVWGATGGLVGGLSTALNPEYQQKVTSFMKDKGVDSDASRAEALKAYQALSKEEKKQLMEMSKEALSDINWFPVTIFVSAVVFGIVGFLGGLIARTWLLGGAVPSLSFLLNNPVIRFQMAKDLSTLQKVIVVVLAQFVVCYLLAYCGARLGLRRKHKKETANQAIEATV